MAIDALGDLKIWVCADPLMRTLTTSWLQQPLVLLPWDWRALGCMARIRKIEIRNFRAIGRLDWFPLAGINCLIGPGDSGKSTILDAIDFCLGARRNLTFCDDDFHRLQLDQPIQISVTLGELDSHLRSMEAYGLYLRGYNFQSGAIDAQRHRS